MTTTCKYLYVLIKYIYVLKMNQNWIQTCIESKSESTNGGVAGQCIHIDVAITSTYYYNDVFHYIVLIFLTLDAFLW